MRTTRANINDQLRNHIKKAWHLKHEERIEALAIRIKALTSQDEFCEKELVEIRSQLEQLSLAVDEDRTNRQAESKADSVVSLDIQRQISQLAEVVNGRQPAVYLGTWDSDTLYDPSDEVTYGPIRYACLASNRDMRPDSSSDFWLATTAFAGSGAQLAQTLSTNNNLLIRRSGITVQGKIRAHENLELAAQTLTAGASIAWDMSAGWMAKVTLTGNGQNMSNPMNVTQYSSGKLYIAPAGFTGLTFSSNWDFNASAPAMPASGKGLILGWDSPDGAKLVTRVFAEYTI